MKNLYKNEILLIGIMLGAVITLMLAQWHAEGMRKDFNTQVFDFANGRGSWIAPDLKRDWPPHFRFRYFEQQAPAPPKKRLTHNKNMI